MRVFVKESVTVPANSEIIIKGTWKQAEYIDTRYASLEPLYDDSSHMLVDRCLVDPVNGRIPVRVANLEHLPLKFKNNLMLGEMHPVEDFCYMDNTDVGAEVCSNNNYGLLKRVCSADIAPITEVHLVVPEIPENWKSISVAKVDNVHVSGNVTSEGSDSMENLFKLSKLPDYLIDLYNRSCTNLKDESLQENLVEVLVKHQQAFAKTNTILVQAPL